jgi:hypothetical protein
MSQTRIVLAAAVCLAVAGSSASAQQYLRFIATELESQPTPLPTVPPSVTDALLQAKVFGSPNGNYWTAQFITLVNGVTSRAIVSGTRTGIDFALAREQVMPGLNVAFETSAVGIETETFVNNAGDVSISGNLVGSTADEAIVLYKRSDQTFSFIAREGSPIPGIAGENFGGSLDHRQLLSDGRVIFRDTATSGSLPSAEDEFIFSGGPNGAGFQSLYQGGVTVPAGQSNEGTAILSDVELGYGQSEDGSVKLVRGILFRAAPNVVVVRNNVVVVEQGQPLPGAISPTPEFSTAFSISDAGVGPGGHWWATGRSTSGGPSWLVANGQIVFTADGDFPGGDLGERVSGITQVNFTTDGTLCYSIFTNLARYLTVVIPPSGPAFRAFDTSIEVDLNNNGDPSDDFFTATTIFSSFLSDDGTLYLIVRRNGVGDVIGWVPAFGSTGPTCNDVDINNDGSSFDPQDIDAFLSVFSEGPCVPETATCDSIDFNNDASLFDPCDIDSFLLVFSEGPCTLCGV